MIHHLSIPARDPARVAAVLAELLGGPVTGFGPWPGGFIAWAGDEVGTAIEVYPADTEMLPDPGGGQARFRAVPRRSPYVATHAAVSVSRDRAAILRIAEREGWHAAVLSRGPNEVIEFWIENAVMLELMTPEMAADYVAATGFARRAAARSGGAADR
ncbi:MAG: hypothetical protein RJA99_2392 [Pseudomonadota bacterium]